MSTTQKYVPSKIIESVSIAAPAVRMVIIDAGASTSEEANGYTWHIVYPVLAIQAKHVHHILREGDGKPFAEVPASLAYLDDSPWWREGTEVEYDYLILNDEYGLCEAGFALNASNTTWKAFVTPWAAEEDETRLADEIAELKSEASGKANRWVETTKG